MQTILNDAITTLKQEKQFKIDQDPDGFKDQLKIRFDINANRAPGRSTITEPIFEEIVKDLPAYKELEEKERGALIEADAKKNEALAVKGQLESAINPIEVQDKGRLILDGKAKIQRGLDKIRDLVENIHVPKFKNTWRESLKEIAEGSASVPNLLQRLVERTTQAVKDMQSRLTTVHGVNIREDRREQYDRRDRDRDYDRRDRDRDYDRQDQDNNQEGNNFLIGGNPDLIAPQSIYALLVSKMGMLKEMIDQLISFMERNSNSTALMSTNGEPSMFVQLYNKFIEDRADPKKSMLEAAERIVNGTKVNQMYPGDVLKIDIMDKSIFIGLTLLLRMIALTIMEYMIDKKNVKTIQGALYTYLLCYSILFVGFVILVNLDLYRMRIVFNFINVHGGYGAVIGHAVMLWLFAILLFIILRNINYKDKSQGSYQNQAITAEDRSNLKNRMSVLSGILWIFTSMVAAIT